MLIYFIIIFAIATRLIPHMANIAVVTALGMFAAAHLSKKQAVGLVMLVRFVSDLFLGFFSWPLMVAVYASHLVGVLFGLWIKRSVDKPADKSASKWMKILASSVGGALIFFLITNFAFLYAQYPHTWSGIILSYINGLPFLRGTLIGDVGYAVVLFGVYDLVRYFSRAKTTARVLDNNNS